MISELDVYLWNHKVGTLLSYNVKYQKKFCFYFDKSFISKGWDISPLCASISSPQVEKGLPIFASDDKLYSGLPPFIADSLPDDWGKRVFTQWANTRRIRVKDISPLDALAYMGSRAMGALEFRPPMTSEFESLFEVDIKNLYESASQIVKEACAFNTGLQPDLLTESIFRVGTSAGGRRPKAVININLSTKQCYSGQVNAPSSDFIPCIIKFDEHIDIPLTRIEYSYYLMAKDAGIDMMPCWLLEGESECHFLTQRFDRLNKQKIHTQTLAAINPSANSYEDLFETALRLRLLPTELKQIFTAMTMNIICGNVDDHTKNFSFMMSQDGVWHLAPTYDFCYSLDSTNAWYTNRHCLSVNGKLDNISRSDILNIARTYDIKGAQKIIDKCVSVSSSYSTYAHLSGINQDWAQRISNDISKNLLIFQETRPQKKRTRKL